MHAFLSGNVECLVLAAAAAPWALKAVKPLRAAFTKPAKPAPAPEAQAASAWETWLDQYKNRYAKGQKSVYKSNMDLYAYLFGRHLASQGEWIRPFDVSPLFGMAKHAVGLVEDHELCLAMCAGYASCLLERISGVVVEWPSHLMQTFGYEDAITPKTNEESTWKHILSLFEQNYSGNDLNDEWIIPSSESQANWKGLPKAAFLTGYACALSNIPLDSINWNSFGFKDDINTVNHYNLYTLCGYLSGLNHQMRPPESEHDQAYYTQFQPEPITPAPALLPNIVWKDLNLNERCRQVLRAFATDNCPGKTIHYEWHHHEAMASCLMPWLFQGVFKNSNISAPSANQKAIIEGFGYAAGLSALVHDQQPTLRAYVRKEGEGFVAQTFASGHARMERLHQAKHHARSWDFPVS